MYEARGKDEHEKEQRKETERKIRHLRALRLNKS